METGQPSLARKIGTSLEVLTNLLYLANVNAEDRVQSGCYMTLAEEKLTELVELFHCQRHEERQALNRPSIGSDAA
jgi:hypothetical protein